MVTGIKDKVAIIGMGCSKFGERWDMGAEELMVEAFEECLADAEVRARRRHLELAARGKQVPFEQILDDIVARDQNA